MTDGPTRAEWDRLYLRMEQGFDGINERLDAQNGRIGKGEVANAVLAQRITSLEKETFRRPRRRHADHAGEGEDWAASFSKREYALMTLGFAVIMAMVKLVEFLGEKLWTVVMSGKA